LLKKVSIDIEVPLNAAFRSDLEQMSSNCRKRLETLLANEFLVMTSLLDPRYTTEIESLMNKQFREYFETFANFYKDLQQVETPNDLYVKEEDSINVQDYDDNASQNYDFWNLLGEQELSSSQNVPVRTINDQLEV